ncbi:MAG: thioredoxin family protein [Ruminococcus sp.]|nr:thioredoxin family protein [Ruminococcus sp.]
MQLLFFHATYCPPCKGMETVARQYAEETGISLYTFRVDDVYGGSEMARSHKVKRLPCLILADETGAERTRTEAVHTLETLRIAFNDFMRGGNHNE